MSHLSMRALLLISAAVLVSTGLPTSPRAQAPEKQPNVTANADGSCTIHRGTAGDIRIENGATYHRQKQKFYPERTYLCKDGQINVVKE
ncbi:MAG TPA: hypothetical protein VH020_08140 [Stellaceae bacterium]|jgi:hypothetical protein|nr:hypothetical protein [Stellaceae bacterium]